MARLRKLELVFASSISSNHASRIFFSIVCFVSYFHECTDLLVSGTADGFVLLNDGTGTYTAHDLWVASIDVAPVWLAADVTGDGALDIIEFVSEQLILRQRADISSLSFDLSTCLWTDTNDPNTARVSITVADFSARGCVDILVSSSTGHAVFSGTCSSQGVTWPALPTLSTTCAGPSVIVDANSDGCA